MTLQDLLNLIGILSTAMGHPEVPAILSLLQRLAGSMQAQNVHHVTPAELNDAEMRVALARARAIAAGQME